MSPQETAWCDGLAAERGWPSAVAVRAYEIWGGRIFNAQSRFVRGLHRRIIHALEAWEEKYGPFNDAQEDYAHKLLIWALDRARDEGADDTERYRFALHTIAQLVNHEKAHAGFLRRRDELSGVDCGELLKRVPR